MTRRATVLMLPLLLLTACGGEEPAANKVEPVAEAPAAPEPPAAPVPSLDGAWTVTAYNGAPLTQVFPMSATFADGTLSILSECERMSWAYTQERNVVSFNPGAMQGCGRGRTDSENQVERALELANIAIFANDGKEVQFSGPGGSVTMTR